MRNGETFYFSNNEYIQGRRERKNQSIETSEKSQECRHHTEDRLIWSRGEVKRNSNWDWTVFGSYWVTRAALNELIDVEVSRGRCDDEEKPVATASGDQATIRESSRDDFGSKSAIGGNRPADAGWKSRLDGLAVERGRLRSAESKRCIGTRWAIFPGMRRTVNFFRSLFFHLKHEKQWQGSDSSGLNSADRYSNCSAVSDGINVPETKMASTIDDTRAITIWTDQITVESQGIPRHSRLNFFSTFVFSVHREKSKDQ